MPDDSSEILQFPSVRERQTRKVRAKLGFQNEASPVADRVVEDVARAQERSERQQVLDLVRLLEARGYGPKRLHAELTEQGVDAELISACVRTSEDHWLEVAIRYVSKKYARDISYAQQTPNRQEQAKIRNRIARNLFSRGFHSEAVVKTLGQLQI